MEQIHGSKTTGRKEPKIPRLRKAREQLASGVAIEPVAVFRHDDEHWRTTLRSSTELRIKPHEGQLSSPDSRRSTPQPPADVVEKKVLQADHSDYPR
jgi:hypothetical protein